MYKYCIAIVVLIKIALATFAALNASSTFSSSVSEAIGERWSKQGIMTKPVFDRLETIQNRIVDKHVITDSDLRWGLGQLMVAPPKATSGNEWRHFVYVLSDLGAGGVRYTPSQKSELLKVLAPYLRSKNATVVDCVAGTLCLIGGPRALGYLKELETNKDADIRNNASFALEHLFVGPK